MFKDVKDLFKLLYATVKDLIRLPLTLLELVLGLLRSVATDHMVLLWISVAVVVGVLVDPVLALIGGLLFVTFLKLILEPIIMQANFFSRVIRDKRLDFRVIDFKDPKVQVDFTDAVRELIRPEGRTGDCCGSRCNCS